MTDNRYSVGAVLCAGVLLGACGGGEAAEELTYWQHVAPIYYDSCVTCHREDGVGPFRLDTYESARAWALPSAAAVSERTMPPWLITDDGSCGEFHGSRALSPADIEVIVRWAEQGALQGEPRTDLQRPEPPSLAGGTDVHTPDFVPEIVGGPLATADEYRCFLIEHERDRDMFLTAYEVMPGNEAIVHHVILMTVDMALDVGDGKTNRDVIAALDAESPDRDGWPCFGGSGEGVVDDGMPVVWAPGQGVVRYPAGTGVRIGAEQAFVVQMHYNLVRPELLGQSDSTAIRLALEDSVDRPAIMLLPDLFLDSLNGDQPASLPPGQESALFVWEVPISLLLAYLGEERLDLYGVMPHMHELGTKIRMDIVDDGLRCTADVQRWDFHWQLQYFYRQPIALEPGGVLRVTCEYDTRGRQEPVLPGWGTANEMCLMGMFLVP